MIGFREEYRNIDVHLKFSCKGVRPQGNKNPDSDLLMGLCEVR